MKQLLMLFVLSMVFVPSALATTYYVSTSGNDLQAGTPAQPWRTIQKAADVMVAGDTVNVQPGNYPQRVNIKKSGTSGNPITFVAQGTVVTKGFSLVNIINNPPGRLPVDHIVIKGFEIANTDYVRWNEEVSSGIFIKGGYNLIENNYIHDSALNGITLFGTPTENTATHDNIVRNNRLYHNEMVGITISGRNNLIEGNEIWDSVQCHPTLMAVEGPGCPNYAATGSSLDADGLRYFGQGHIIRKNYIHDINYGAPGINPLAGDYNATPHIDCFQTWSNANSEVASNILIEQNRCEVLVSQTADESGHAFMLAGGANNITIMNNILKAYGGTNTGGTGGAHHLYIYNNLWINNLAFTQFNPRAISLSSAPYSIVKNNILYDQPEHTIVTTGETSGQEVDYNLAFNSSGTEPDCFRIANFVCKNPPPTNHLWNVDPKFIDPSIGDYRLQSSSPAINKGTTISQVTNDYDGNGRPGSTGYDIGPYEVQNVASIPPSPSTSPSIYWGAYVKGASYNMPGVDPPWDWTAVDTFEAHAGGKRMSLFQSVVASWSNANGYIAFSSYQMNLMRGRGYIPYLDWQSRNSSASSNIDQPSYALRAIIRGDHDAFITQWATGAKNWGYPFFLRFNAEMNGTWWAYSEARNGNSTGEFAQAWRHVHDIFTTVGANNATWVWCPNVDYPGSISLEGLYPGDAYVDWTCMDGYNWGTTNPNHLDTWKSFSQVMTPTYNHLLAIAPSKPIFIGEFGSDEGGGSKAAWITDALTTQIPNNFPKIKAISWFNLNVDGANWVIESSPAAQAAFAAGIASSYYAQNSFGSLPTGQKIIPLGTPAIPGDINGDSRVNLADLVAATSNISISTYNTVVANYGKQ